MAKLNENYQNFFKQATAAGFGTNEIVSFMQSMFENPSSTAERSRLKEGQSKGTLRPDELVGLQAIHGSQSPERFIKAATSAATKIGSAGYAATKLPELLKKGMGALEAIGKIGSKEKVSQEESTQQPSGFQEFMKQNPELGAFLQKQLSSGIPPEQAAMKAKAIRKFMEPIAEIEDNVGQPFESLLSQLFQGSKSEKRPEQPAQSSEKISQLLGALRELKELRSRK